ncbi:MAG TPA: beta-ketoacyl-ACP synthase II [Thermoanaerobacterales bacterium]|nr:beta-ketoacyl-ACP synthase II [Thermoanaerobacterales bacterium]
MKKNRVVITGLGVVSPVGTGIERYWESLLNGRSGINKITKFDTTDYNVKIAGEVKDFCAEDYMDRKEARRMDRFSQFAVASTAMAIKDSQLDLEKEDPLKIGIVLGSGTGGIETMAEQFDILIQKGPRRVSPFFIPMYIPNMAAAQIAMNFNAKGPNFTVMTACAAGTHAIGEAFRLIERGDIEIAITGGSEAPITPLALAGFTSMKALSTNNEEPDKACRPFDMHRDGFVMSEGAGIIILESLEHAKKRDAKIYAELVGYGNTSDAYHITQPAPDGEGAARAIEQAINDAGIKYDMVDYINAHGTSTPLNDKLETMAIKKVFKEHSYKITISSTKSMVGHLLGAAGAVEFIATTLTVKYGIVPPTINYQTKDPDCDLDYTPNKAKAKEIIYALSNSFGFGGNNGTLLIKKNDQ